MSNQNHKTSGATDTVGLSPGFNTEIIVKCTTVIQNNIVQWSYGAHTQYCTVELWSAYTILYSGVMEHIHNIVQWSYGAHTQSALT